VQKVHAIFEGLNRIVSHEVVSHRLEILRVLSQTQEA